MKLKDLVILGKCPIEPGLEHNFLTNFDLNIYVHCAYLNYGHLPLYSGPCEDNHVGS